MATVIVLNARETDPYVRLRGALSDARRILGRIGVIMEAGSQQAFDDQRLGDWIWPERYPNQSEPFINVAGAVSDFVEGRTSPKGRRFDRRPALRDTSELFGSIRSRVIDDETVETGTTVEHGPVHQWGGISTMNVPAPARSRMVKWLLTDEGAPYQKKLAKAAGASVLETEVVQRPFLGVTPQMEDDIQDTVERMIAEAAGGGS
jgi:phage gpG-like protein